MIDQHVLSISIWNGVGECSGADGIFELGGTLTSPNQLCRVINWWLSPYVGRVVGTDRGHYESGGDMSRPSPVPSAPLLTTLVISRRGHVYIIRSDHGTHFIGAERVFRGVITYRSQFKSQRPDEQTEWIFNPPVVSYHLCPTGQWGRCLVLCLNRVLDDDADADDGLHTLLLYCVKVESVLNSTPWTKMSESPNDLEALTPNHILLM